MLQFNPQKYILRIHVGQQLCNSHIHNLHYYIPSTSGFVLKQKQKWSFPHQVMNILILRLPYSGKHFDSTLHFPFEGYILSHYEALEEEKL